MPAATVTATSLLYAFTFGPLGGVNRATVASPQNLPLPAGGNLPVAISNLTSFTA